MSSPLNNGEVMRTKLVDIQLIKREWNQNKPYVNMPTYATEMSAAVDLVASIPRPITLYKGMSMLVSAGFKMHINSPYICAKIYPRSGLATKKGLVLGNLVGIVDADYQGEVKVCLWNRNIDGLAVVIEPDERIAQMVFEPIVRVNFVPVDTFVVSERAEGGFGSTGA